MKTEKHTYKIRISGLVQGVGFRPFIYRIANRLSINGTVDNRNDGVLIVVIGTPEKIERFIETIREEAPPASNIENITADEIENIHFNDFKIVKSSNNTIRNEITEISPDIAVCDDCLADMKSQPHRINYPFINCTNCGPRFTIIKELPYDRPLTTMADFQMCPTCKEEYINPSDRRFHAQPVACNHCGPHYTMHKNGEQITNFDTILDEIDTMLSEGQTVAVKGLGGYHLLCDAQNEKAVIKLRHTKFRDGKPLAVMFKDLTTLNHFASVTKEEAELLKSWRRPIVLLSAKNSLAPSVSVGFSTVGAMLPYMPFHYLMFDKISTTAVVFTSANISGEPLIIDNKKALEAFANKTAAVVTYNRDIYNRTDDSVCLLMDKKPAIIRRSRSYAPSPIRLKLDVDGILAVGAELVSTFCIGRTNQAILSQYIGDLKNAETMEFFEESISRYKLLYKFEPKVVVSDLHPDYLSSKLADKMGFRQVKVQHHHAHIAAAMAEHGLDEKVIGISMDGTGLGTDGNIWGGEFFIADLQKFERFTHFNYIPLPGGDSVTKEPWRTALSYLYAAYGNNFWSIEIPFVKKLDRQKSDFLIQMVDKSINSPLSSSAGRLFDAVSALIDICTISSFHAEAPMRLEDIIEPGITGSYPYHIDKTIDFIPAIKAIVNDLQQAVPAGIIAARFHNTIINVAEEVSIMIRLKTGINRVVLSGGSFQNRYLSLGIDKRLTEKGFEVFMHRKVPANDSGIALGQLVIAAKLLESENGKNT